MDTLQQQEYNIIHTFPDVNYPSFRQHHNTTGSCHGNSEQYNNDNFATLSTIEQLSNYSISDISPQQPKRQQHQHQQQFAYPQASPALSVDHSSDGSVECSDNDCASTLLSWGSTSYSDSNSGMTSSPLNPRHAPSLITQFPVPWIDNTACAPAFSNDDAYLLSSAAYSDFNLDFALDGDYAHTAGPRYPTFVDPSVINTIPSPPAIPNFLQNNYVTFAPAQPLSPALSLHSLGHHGGFIANSRSVSPLQPQWPIHTPTSASPLATVNPMLALDPSMRSSADVEEDHRLKNRCPYPDCGKVFKDLRAHMLTHQDERPEKCPITSCEFHKRGFARKYDRNRHLVTTHYKSTIVCGFCPGSGSAAEKSFNRTDVFKRHLVAVHGVEQTPPNGRKKSPLASGRQSPTQADGTTGKCSTCGFIFANAQDLFEHLDDCVLRVVQQIDPAEANNEKQLMSVAEDDNVKQTMKTHGLDTSSSGMEASFDASNPADDDDEGYETVDECNNKRSNHKKTTSKSSSGSTSKTHAVQTGRISKATNNKIAQHKFRTGLTFSKGGVVLHTGNKSQRRRREYPRSWGCPNDTMKLKKRVLCVFDGQRRLWKDDMMLGNDQEVRVKLADGHSYVTDLDVQSLNRAEGVYGATDEQRGPWLPTNTSKVHNLEEFDFGFDQLLQ